MASAIEVFREVDVVDDQSVEELIESKAIGRKIRRLRLKRSMGLVALGRLTGLSASFLSQLETGRVVPTLKNLARISMALEKDLSCFFRQEKTDFFNISRTEKRLRLPLRTKESSFVIFEHLSSLIPNGTMDPQILDFPSQVSGSSGGTGRFAGIELVYVLHGSVRVSFNNQVHLLQSADAAWIDGTSNRRYGSDGKAPAKALIIGFPDHPVVRPFCKVEQNRKDRKLHAVSKWERSGDVFSAPLDLTQTAF